MARRLIIGILLMLPLLGIAKAQSGRLISIPESSEQPPKPETVEPPPQPPPAPVVDERGTTQSPIIVKLLPNPKTPAEEAEEERARDDRSSTDRWLVRLIGLLGFIALLQLVVFAVQAVRIRQAVKKMDNIGAGQAMAMHAAMEELSRAAKAMERVAERIGRNVETIEAMAKTQREFWQMQMRAYLSVVSGGALYQERERGLKFEGKPMVLNTGHTPARNVTYRARAAILPAALPADFSFSLPEEGTGAAILGAQQSFTFNTAVDAFCDNELVAAVRRGDASVLHVWGVVTYDDVFGTRHETSFWQTITWSPDGRVVVAYGPRHNTAT